MKFKKYFNTTSKNNIETFYNQDIDLECKRRAIYHHVICFYNKVFYANDGAYLVGFPKKQTVEAIIENIEDFYDQKVKRNLGYNFSDCMHFQTFSKNKYEVSKTGW